MNLMINYWLLFVLLTLSGCSQFNKLNFDPTTDIAGKAKKITSSQPRPLASETPITPPEVISKKPLPDVMRFPGNNQFIKPQLPPSTDVSDATQPGDVTLNFEGTDIREVVKVILNDLLGINYIIDPGVQGSVTMSTARPLTKDVLLSTLETMLRMNKAALVYKNGTYYVMPAATAIQGEIVPQLGSNSQPLPNGYSVRIVPLRYIGVTEMDKILKPLAPEGSIIRIDPVRNLMILAGASTVLNNLLETIETFDVNWIKGLSIGIFRIKNAELESVMKQVESLIAVQDNNPLSDMFKVTAIESANSLLVISHQQEYLDQIGEWIERLDQIGVNEEAAPNLYVYRVKHGDSENLADMLGQLFSEDGAKKSTGGARVAPGMTSAKISSKKNSTEKSDSTTNSSPDNASSAATTDTTTGGSTAYQLESGISIVADTVNNSLLLRATPAQYKEIEMVLEKIDILPLQVLVEATIVEITLTGSLNYGLQWFFKGHHNEYNTDFGWSGIAKPTNFNWSLIKGADDVRAVLSAFAGDGLVKILSSPSVMVLDNHTANIKVGSKVPIVTSNINSDDDDYTENSSTNYQDTGVILNVTPRVTPGGLVIMEVDQEVSEPVAVEKGNPPITTRNINSTVAVKDGQVVVLGGLIKDTQDQSQNGIPGLYKAPVLSWLFGQTTKSANRTELVIVLAPKVLRNDDDIGRITDEFKAKLHGLKDGF
jgi:general secretion pathway protein D